MKFASPALLWAVALIPVLAAGYVVLERRRRAAERAFATDAMRPNVAPVYPGWRRHIPAVVLLAGMLVLSLAVARPRADAKVPRERATVVLALDASRSMESRDVDPSRIAAARKAARAFVDDLPARFKIGVVSFARSPEVLSHPTSDRVALRAALGQLDTTLGTSIGDALVKALELRPPASGGRQVPMIVVLLSDGNNKGGEVTPSAAAEAARADHVRVFTISFGRGDGGSSGEPPVDAATLRELARRTGGRFYSAPSGTALEAVLDSLGSEVAYVNGSKEVTATFVGAGLALLVAAGGLAALWFNRVP